MEELLQVLFDDVVEVLDSCCEALISVALNEVLVDKTSNNSMIEDQKLNVVIRRTKCVNSSVL